MKRYNEVLEKLRAFRKSRDWEKFHTPKNLAMGISIEASELLLEFLWKTDQEVKEKVENSPQSVVDEIADIATYLMLLSSDLNINIFDAIEQKMAKNGEKYPIEKCYGKATKYNEL
jgi:NTP pyrophosphatase (non-canonical NTP hydrolase)